jgi:hypothetical protein
MSNIANIKIDVDAHLWCRSLNRGTDGRRDRGKFIVRDSGKDRSRGKVRGNYKDKERDRGRVKGAIEGGAEEKNNFTDNISQ